MEQTTHASLDLVLLGAPGSGKGTQAEQLKTLFNLPHISTGDIFRKNITEETELGQVAKSYMNRGELVPDDITEGMVQDRLAEPDADQGFILDGFPRTYPQAEALTDMMTGLERRLDAVLYIKVSDEEIVERLSGRLVCKGCQTSYHVKYNPPAQEGVCDACGKSLYQRDDDNVITVQTRLDTFHAQTAPLIDYYKKEGLLIEIQGEDEIETITAKTVAIVEQLRQTIENATKA
ncbi:MAG: adenylate kinase [Chloroflexota bacterium]